MYKNKIRLMIAGFALAATWAATARAQPQDVECNGQREPVSRGQAKHDFGFSDQQFNAIDDDEDQHICCKIVGNEITQCQDDRFDD